MNFFFFSNRVIITILAFLSEELSGINYIFTYLCNQTTFYLQNAFHLPQRKLCTH